MKRNDTQFEYSVEWTIENAAKAGLVKDKSGWDKYPGNMLRWITLGFCADVVAPDIAALRRTVEFGEPVDEGGEPVVWSEVTTSIPDASIGVLSKSQLEGESTTRPLPPAPHSLVDEVAMGIAKGRPVPTATMVKEAAQKILDVAQTQHHGVDKLMKDKFSGPCTIDALIAAGYTADQIVAANDNRIPSTAEDCIRVAEILEEQDATD